MSEDTDPFSDAVFHHFLTLLRKKRRHAHQIREEQGISPLQFSVVRFLLETGPAKVSQVQRYIQHSPGATSTLVSQLEGIGLVTRTRSQADNRVVMVALTEAGRDVASNAPFGGLPLLRRRLHELPEERLIEIDSVLSDLMRLMETETE